MEGSEGTSQTELYTGWSSVVHQPCEDIEESELPSTVDITAFSTNLNVEPSSASNQALNSDSDSESDADSSNSGSEESDSSESESSTSDSSSRSSSPEFSVTSSRTDGLRLTIATVKKPGEEKPTEQKDDFNFDAQCENKSLDDGEKRGGKNKISESGKDSGNKGNDKSISLGRNEKKSDVKTVKKDTLPSKGSSKGKTKSKNCKKMTAPLSREYACCSSDDGGDSKTEATVGDDSVSMLASCSLQEIRQEDLAAILPDQQECDAFGTFEKEENGKNGVKRSSEEADMSDSDMELPHQAVNALIQRTTESSSESETELPNPPALYANSLLQQFEVQTQMLSTQMAACNGKKTPVQCKTDVTNKNEENPVEIKRRRGRPKKCIDTKSVNAKEMKKHTAYSLNPNVSPDSGIQNSPDHISSPEPTLLRNTLYKEETKDKKISNEKKIGNKLSITTDRHFYGHSERTLYPPRRKVGRPAASSKKKVTDTKTVHKNLRDKKNKIQQETKPNETVKKSKSSNLFEICERVSKRLESGAKSGSKVQKKAGRTSISPNKTEAKQKVPSLKNAKVLHSKHRHKIHKKRKFRILKPLAFVAQDPKINIEIEKLTTEFDKLCISNNIKSSKDQESLKSMKRVSKKRKTKEYERKGKKQNVTTVNKIENSNEQRLPLKKRHYHAITNKTEEEKDVKIENNNEIESKDVHIEEAIEACINNVVDRVKKGENVPTPTVATTPKKRHRLVALNEENKEILETSKRVKTSIESVVTELKMKKSVNEKSENTAQMITRKKNRLEDLTSNLSMKINPNPEKKSETLKNVRYPACKKTKPNELEQLDAITSAQPTGIFMPTVDVEFPTTFPIPDDVKTVQEPATAVITAAFGDGATTANIVTKKVRKRRAPNRTGFPTVKKKKKKVVVPAETVAKKTEIVCDRVPADGEEYTSFLNRTADDAMSECDSLPQEERTELHHLDEFQLGPDYSMREDSPTTSVDTRDSGTTEVDLDDLPIGKRLKKAGTEGVTRKRRLRDRRSSLDAEKKGVDVVGGATEEKKGKKTPRWKKRYLVAGLFSDYYKEHDESARLKRKENASKYAKSAYIPSDHPHGLLPPPHHCGKYLRCRNLPFQLPYDLWWRHTHSQLPGRDLVPSWNYRKIRTNVYNIKTTGTSNSSCEHQTCNCTPAQRCGDDCINRMVLSECMANVHRCQNQRIQRHEWSPGLEKFMTKNKGWGIRTKLPIKSNDFLLEYVGEVVSDQEFKERMATIYVNDTHHYCLHLDTGMVIDGHRMGGDGRFVNHSCEPNCEMQKWQVNGQFRMALFALRDIEAGEELSYDYNFSLFDPAEGQECKCGSEMCRGVIGGKSQRVRRLPQAPPKTGRVGRPRKVTATVTKKREEKEAGPTGAEPKREEGQAQVSIQVKPISHQQKCYILEHHCFLLRNINKVRKVKDRAVGVSFVNRPPTAPPPTDHGTAFLNHLNALQKPRNMKTRRIAQAEDNPDFNRSVKIASVLKDIYDAVVNYKDEGGAVLATPFLNLPSKRKSPELYQTVGDPIDFATVEQKIAKGAYRNTDSFDNDMNRVLSGFTKFYGCSSEQGVAAVRLRKVYQESKRGSSSKFQELLGAKPPANFVSKRDKSEEEDIIRCICGMYHDEGLMIQCERCLVWQHCECVKADPTAPSYHCEICVPRDVDYEIPMDEFTEHGHRYYLTLMRGDLQLRQGDTVYVLRDISIPGTDRKHNYQTIGKMDFNDLDIFRIERLWKDSGTGQRYAYGHHYLRPHETYHEPTRKFFPNEVMRVPLYEAVPVELIISHCWVLDLNTFLKGRPIDAEEKHTYICEYRVDKSARLFNKVSRAKYPVCTKSYVFERFPERLKISRTYTPHDLGDVVKAKPSAGRKPQEEGKQIAAATTSDVKIATVPKVRDLNEQKTRLNNILLKLSSKLPTKQVVDASYLLEGGRRRKGKNLKLN